jgi:hypothetical protein
MSVVASISPEPSPYTIGSQGVYLVRLRDKVLNTPVRGGNSSLSGKFGTVVLTGAMAWVDQENGLFSWASAATDSPTTAGRYGLQFKATGTPGGVIENDPVAIDVKVAL